MAGVQGTLLFNGVEFPGGFVAVQRMHYAWNTRQWQCELSWWMTKTSHDAGESPIFSDAFPSIDPFPDTPNSNPIDSALVTIKSWFPDGVIFR